MSKFGKFLFFSACAGAAAYGAYYYLRKEEILTATTVNEDEDASAFDEDLDGEPTKARSYVNLTFDKAKAEDVAKNAVEKAKKTLNGTVEKVEEFFNDEPKDLEDEIKEAAADAVEVAEGTIEEVSWDDDPEDDATIDSTESTAE